MFERFKNASGIIFDCDGCLLDSMDAWHSVEYALIEATGVPWTQAQLEEMRAAPMSGAAKIFHERYGLMDSNEAIERYMHDTMWEYYTTKAQMRAGAAEFFARLRAAKVSCSIVSSTPEKYLRAGLTHVGIVDELVAIVSTEETGLSKQDPAIYKLALDKMHAEASSSWGFDDSLYAIRVMNAVGLSTVGTYDADDAGTFDELSAQATLAIRSFTELLD